MRKERRNLLLAVLTVVVAMGGLGWLMLRSNEPPEPVYQGKRLSEWLGDHDERPSQVVPPDPGVVLAVRQIGTNGIPILLRMLRARDSALKLKLIGLAQKQHLMTIHFVPAEQRNWEAATGFDYLGAGASNAVPALIHIYEENISDVSQMSTIAALVDIGPAATAAIPVLLRTAGNTNASAQVRGRAALSLAQLHAAPGSAVPALIKCLNDSEPIARFLAARGILLFGSKAREAVPALVDLLKDPAIGEQAGLALKAVDPEAAAKVGIK